MAYGKKEDVDTQEEGGERLKYEESLANVNKVGKYSICLELNPKYHDFLDAICNTYLDLGEEPKDNPMYDVLMVLAGECCEGDYIVTTDENEDHDFEALRGTIDAHEWTQDIPDELLRSILKNFKELLWKRSILWG